MEPICEKTGVLLPGPEDLSALPENQCAVHLAEQVAQAACGASCGQDVFCRDGMYQLHLIIGDIARGKGRARDLELIPELCSVIEENAGCDLAVRAARKIRALVELKQDQWRAHVLRKLCRPGACPMPSQEGSPVQQPVLRRRRRAAAQ